MDGTYHDQPFLHRPIFEGAHPPEDYRPWSQSVGKRGPRQQPSIRPERLVDLGDIAGLPLRSRNEVRDEDGEMREQWALVTMPIPAEVAKCELRPGPKLAVGALLLHARTRRTNLVERARSFIGADLGVKPATVGTWLGKVPEVTVHHPEHQARERAPNKYELPQEWMTRRSDDVHVPLYVARLLGPRDALAIGAAYTAMGQKGICWSRQTELGKRVGLGRDAVGSALKTAMEAGIIGVRKRRYNGGMEQEMWLLVPELLDGYEIRNGVDLHDHVFEPVHLRKRQGAEKSTQPGEKSAQPAEISAPLEELLKDPRKEPPPGGIDGRDPTAAQVESTRHKKQPERKGGVRLRSVRDLAPLLGLKLGKGSAAHGGVQCPSCRALRRSKSRKDERRMSANIVKDGRGEGVKCHVPSCGWSGNKLDFIAMAMLGRKWRALRGDEQRQVLGFAREQSKTGAGHAEQPPVPEPEPAAPSGSGWRSREEVQRLWEGCESLMADPNIVEDLSARGLDVERLDALGVARRLPDSAQRPGFARHCLPTMKQHESSGARARRLITGLFSAVGELRGLTARSSIDKTRMRGSGSTAGLVMANPLAQRLLRGERVAVDRVIVAEGESDFFACALAVDDDTAVYGIGQGMWTQAHADRIPDGVTVVIATDHDAKGKKYAQEVTASLERRCLRLERWRPPHGCSDVMDVVEEGLALELRGYCTNPREGEPLGIQCPSQDCSGELVRRKNKVDVMAGDVQTRTLVGCTSWRSRREPGCGTMMSLEAVDRELRAGEEWRERLLDEAVACMDEWHAADQAGSSPKEMSRLLTMGLRAMSPAARSIWAEDLIAYGVDRADLDFVIANATSSRQCRTGSEMGV